MARAIANNSFRSADIRGGNVRSSDIANNGVTGTDVLESSLGEVPAANSANNANALGGVAATRHVKSIGAFCNLGEEVLGGGGSATGGLAPQNIVLKESSPFQGLRPGTPFAGFFLCDGGRD